MKITKLLGLSVLSISLLGLGACGPNNQAASQNNSSGQYGTSSPTTTSGHSKGTSQSKGSNETTDSGTTGTTQTKGNTTSSTTNSSGSGNSSGQGTDSSPTASTPTQQPTAPLTVNEAINDTAQALKTRVPLILPTTFPVSNGHFVTATTNSEPWYYRVNFYETSHPTAINASTASENYYIATVEGTEYTDAAHANSSINGYIINIQTPENQIDLGYNIKGSVEGATGHSYIHWNEGRWSLTVDSPTDPSYENQNGTDLAKQVVAYLNKVYLPAPKSIGAIMIHNWKNNHVTTVEWQFNQITYKVTSQDPMTALKISVASQFISN